MPTLSTDQIDAIKTIDSTLRLIYQQSAPVPDETQAALATLGIKNVNHLKSIGSTRDQAEKSLIEAYEMKNETAAEKRTIIAVLACWQSAVDHQAVGHQREQIAAATGVPVAMESTLHKTRIQNLKDMYPGRHFTREVIPHPDYLNRIENMVKIADARAEQLKQVMADHAADNPKTGFTMTGTNTFSFVGAVSGKEPLNRDQLKSVYKTMGAAWVATALAYPNFDGLVGLRLETFDDFAEFILGPRVADLGSASGGRPKWEDILACEAAIRRSWFEQMADTGKRLNDVILQSIGRGAADPGRVSGLVESHINIPLVMGALGQGKGQKRPWSKAFSDKGGKANTKGGKNTWNFKPNKGGKWDGKGSKNTWNTKGTKNSWKGGKANDGKNQTSSIPPLFKGKLTVCKAHGKPICFQQHTSMQGCPRGAACAFCHICCPEPGCPINCSDGHHGLWCH